MRLPLVLLLLAGTAGAAPTQRVLTAEVLVPAPVEDVWAAWTTNEGIATFFAPQGRVDLRVDGTYDVWFNPAGRPGERGAEGMRIVGLDPLRRFAFTWNAPPSIPTIRGQRTIVVLDFARAGDRQTRMTFTELGWGEGADWDEAYDYFDHAWGAIVLPRLVERFRSGPLDWSKDLKLAPLEGSMKRTLAG